MSKVKCKKCNKKMNKSKKYNGNFVCFVCDVVYRGDESISTDNEDKVIEWLNK